MPLKLEDNSSDHAEFPKVIPNFFEFGQSSEEVTTKNQERRVIVSNQLPLKASRVPHQEFQWQFEWDMDALVLQTKDGFPPHTQVVYVGGLPVEIDPEHQDVVAEYLLDEFKCVPTFLSGDLFNNFYHGFCKHFLWPLFHYMLPVTPNHGIRFDKDMWLDYVSANRIFADKVMEVVNPDEDYVWIHDYHLMILPTFLRKRQNKIKLGFFLHSPFPSSEIYRTLPVRDEILRGLLNCDLVGFQTFDYARHFLNCCGRMLGLEYQSKMGCIALDYLGRTVSVKILPVGIHLGQIEAVMSLPYTANKIRELKRNYDGKVVLLGVDDMDMFKGISLKFMAMGMLLAEHPDHRGSVVLVQIVNSPRSHGQDIQAVQDEITKISNEVNEKYGDPASGYQPIVCVNGPVSFQEKVSYYSIAECVVVNAFRDGMNLVPYKYTAVRQGCQELDNALKVGDKTPRKSVIILSEFIGCSPSLSGAIRVNPWDVYRLFEAMYLAINMRDSEKETRHKKHYMYIMSHDVAYWTQSLDQDLMRACSEHYRKMCWELGFGLHTKVIALGPNFRKLLTKNVVPAYIKSSRRLILLDYDGTMLPHNQADKFPNYEIISVLNSLSSDPNNIVFIVSGRGRDPLAAWFSECDKLGLSAEHGYFTRWTKSSEWISSNMVIDLNWKKIVLPIMTHYTEATDGSWIESKETAFVWNYQEADPDFGSRQAKELLDHLEGVLTNDPVMVCKGQYIVEVKPQGVSKGLVMKYLAETVKNMGQQADFVLCIGDDRSDEDMFEVISSAVEEHSLSGTAELFPCTVGQKPSLAKFYLDDTYEVIKMLQTLVVTSVGQDAMPNNINGVAFESGPTSRVGY